MDHGESSYRRYLAGDKEAFDAIMKEYFDPLLFFVYRYVRSYESAEDIVIDVMAEFVAHPRRYHFGVSLKTYLFMLAKSRALNAWKRQKRHFSLPLEEALPLADTAPLPEEAVITDERKRMLHRALSTLPQEMATAVHLVYFEEMSYEEAARVLNRSKKQIDNLLYRAKGLLRKILQEEGITK